MVTNLRNGKFFDPQKMSGKEVIDNNIVRHNGMTRMPSRVKTEFQELLEKLSSSDFLAPPSKEIIQQLFDVPSMRGQKSDRLLMAKDESIMDNNNDNFRRFFESLFAKKLLTYILNSKHCEGITLLIQEMTSFLQQEHRQHNSEFLALWEKVRKEGARITDNDSDLFTFSSFRPDLINLVKENHFNSKQSEVLTALYDLHYLTHSVLGLKSYTERHPEGILDIYKKHQLYLANNRGRLIGFGFNKKSPSYNLGILRSVDQAPLDLKKSVLASQETRCVDRLYMEHPNIARAKKDSWLHHCFSNPYNSNYVNGLSGSTLHEIRLILFFIASITNNHYECKFIKQGSLFDNEAQLLKNYLRLILGMFVYIEGGHTFSEILCVFDLIEVAPVINSALGHKDKPNVISINTLITGDEDIQQIILDALKETKHFYSICQQKKTIHREIETLPECNRKPNTSYQQNKKIAIQIKVPPESNQNSVCSFDISMMILGGFIAAIGITAVVLAFTLLSAATFGTAGLVAVGAGVSEFLLGVGIFANSIYINSRTSAFHEQMTGVEAPPTNPFSVETVEKVFNM